MFSILTIQFFGVPNSDPHPFAEYFWICEKPRWSPQRSSCVIMWPPHWAQGGLDRPRCSFGAIKQLYWLDPQHFEPLWLYIKVHQMTLTFLSLPREIQQLQRFAESLRWHQCCPGQSLSIVEFSAAQLQHRFHIWLWINTYTYHF